MKTLIIGASENPERYAYKALKALKNHGHEVVALANREGKVEETEFLTAPEPISAVDTITLYINPKIQESYYDYILSLQPRRVIFNPGTENPSFESMLEGYGIVAEEACTLVLLSTAQF